LTILRQPRPPSSTRHRFHQPHTNCVYRKKGKQEKPEEFISPLLPHEMEMSLPKKATQMCVGAGEKLSIFFCEPFSFIPFQSSAISSDTTKHNNKTQNL